MMNDVRRKQFELLVELDQICQEHKIPYCLFGYTAWQAYTKHEFIEGNMLPPEVAMLPEAARAFIDAFNAANPEGRFIEYMGNNYKFDRLDIRYGDSNTLDFAPNYAHYYENHGLHVTIHVMCYGYTKGLYNKMHTVLANDVAFNIRRTPYEKKHLAFHRARQVWSTVSGRQREAKSLFNYLLDGGKRDKTKVLYKPYDRRHQTFPAYWFSDTIQADLEGPSVRQRVGRRRAFGAQPGPGTAHFRRRHSFRRLACA